MADETPAPDRPVTTVLTEAERKTLSGCDALLFDPVEYDDAIIGVYRREPGHWVAAYDYERLIEVTLAINGGNPKKETDWDDAVQWVDYNMVRGDLYNGKTAPLVLSALADEVPEDMEEDVQIIALANKKWTLA